ncbi:MAG: signal peptidase II [Nanoarchaeota archaeon]
MLWALFLGGALGNLMDRWLRGFVIDFIDLKFWPVFNVADAAITVSVIGLVIYYWKR